MQDRYAGDIGDFSKFALSRALHRELGGPLGLIWFRFPDEFHNNDGRHTGYLRHSDFQGLDDHLLHSLEGVVTSGRRSISALESAGCLPADTIYFGESLSFEGRQDWSREAWFERALRSVADARCVVVDPDNGIAGPNFSTRRHRAGKYITEDEIRRLAGAFPCLVVYHHFDRSESHLAQIERQVSKLKLLTRGSVFALRYSRYSPRAYFVLCDTAVEEAARRGIESISTGKWAKQFTVIDCH